MISIGNHMNRVQFGKIFALSHALEGRVIVTIASLHYYDVVQVLLTHCLFTTKEVAGHLWVYMHFDLCMGTHGLNVRTLVWRARPFIERERVW